MNLSHIVSRIKQHCFSPQIAVIWGISLWLMLTCNHALWSHIVAVYPLDMAHLGFVISLLLFFTLSNTLWLMLFSHGRAGRWVLAFMLISAAWAAYYMDEFGVIIDHIMLDNAAKTDVREVMGLMSWRLGAKMLLLGVLPAWLVFTLPAARFFQREALAVRVKHIGLLLLSMALVVLPFVKPYTEFVREHKMVRMYANPTFFHYSMLKWTSGKVFAQRVAGLQKTAADTQVIKRSPRQTLVIMVVGETARFDRFSLNGYARDTNPRLRQENVLSFKQVTSCGTSTGVSVPCMFSLLTRKQYQQEKALHMENALDVLSQHGVSVLWRDNNSDSKGVALRVPYEDFKSPSLNPVCDDNECRDIGMLSGLDAYVAKQGHKDILIVLHQMGNHGPEYYRRYPAAFKRFTPICMSGRLSSCSPDTVDNAYDNAILYTDYFLSEVIQFLKKYDNSHETAMLYVSDHGESLGEQGVYLHAAPYAMAPKEQTHVPAIVWLGQQFEGWRAQLAHLVDAPLSHDDVFCTLLLTFGMQTQVCQAQSDWLAQQHVPQNNASAAKPTN